MTEVEFSRLLSELSDTAAILNKESDSINDVIEKFEGVLRTTNVGIETWVDIPGMDDQLGWCKLHKKTGPHSFNSTAEWRLTVNAQTGFGAPLSDEPRVLRIAALAAFPILVQKLKKQADESIKKIQEAKKFVAVSPQPPAVSFSAVAESAAGLARTHLKK